MNRATLLTVAVLAAAAVWVLHLLVVAGTLLPLEVPISGEAVSVALRAPRLTDVAQVVEHVTEPAVLYVAGLVVAVVTWLRGRRRAALVSVGIGVLGIVTSPTLKALTDRTRPAVEAGLTTAGGGSFPSGHALASATVLLTMLLVLAPPRTPRSARIRWTATAALLVLIAVDRIWLGAHWPSDVLAGWLLALTLALLGRLVVGSDRHVGRPPA